MRVIGLTGLAGSGKTMVARYLVDNYGFVRIRLADPLKDMLRIRGLTDRHLDGDLKEVPCDMLGGKTPRWVLQRLGTEFFREQVDQAFWVDSWSHRVSELSDDANVVADDVRFPNEVAAIYRYGGIIVHVERSGHAIDAAVASHESETHQLGHDIKLINDGQPGDLFRKVDFRLMRDWPEQVAA